MTQSNNSPTPPTNDPDIDNPDTDADTLSPEDKKTSKLSPLIAHVKKISRETYADLRTNFHPSLWLSVVTAICIIILISLGIWQIQRLQWKRNIIAAIETNQSIPAAPFNEIPTPDNWGDMDYRRVTVTGDYMLLQSFQLLPRMHNGAPGYHLITPLRLNDGRVLLINRGWVPIDKTIVDNHANANDVTVTGMLRVPDTKNAFTPDNNPADKKWFWIDYDSIRRKIGINTIVPTMMYLDAPIIDKTSANDAPTYPLGSAINLNIRNNHAIYIFTWFALAFALLLVWFFYSWQSPTSPTKDEDETDRDNHDDDDL